MAWERIRVILRKEFIQMLRDPRMRGLLFVPPLLQLLIFGYAVTLDVDHARIAWMDMSRTPESRALMQRFEGSGRFDVAAIAESEEDIQRLLDRSEVHAAVAVLPDFARNIARGRTAQVQVLVDGTNSNTATLISAYAAGVVAAFSEDIVKNPLNRPSIQVSLQSTRSGGGFSAPVTADTRVWFNPDLRSRNYFVPGVAANILLIITLILTAQAIIREKELGTLEQLMVTPMRPIELMLGKTLPFVLVGMINTLLITGGSLLIFRVPFRGNFFLLLFCARLFLMTSLGYGLFLSTVSSTQQQANMAAMFFIMPSFMLSGFIFPISNMPLAVQYLSYLNPLLYFMQIVRGIFLKGAGVATLWPQMLVLAFYGTVILGLSALRFRKKLD
jgi:ABC-2 type transport system permease protein